MATAPPATAPPAARTAPVANGLPPRPGQVIGQSTSFLRAMVYGPPGAGKTVLGATLPKPVLFLDCDDGLLAIRSLGRKDEKAERLRQALGLTLEDVAQIYHQPIRSLADTFAIVQQLHREFAVDPNRYGGIVFDNLTEYQRVLMGDRTSGKQESSSSSPLGGQPASRMPQIQDWGVILIQLQGIIRSLKRLPCHLLLVAHESNRQVQGADIYGPALSGKLYEEIPGYVDCMFRYVFAQQEQADPNNPGKTVVREARRLRCTPSIGQLAKDRSGTLSDWEMPNLALMIKKMFG